MGFSSTIKYSGYNVCLNKVQHIYLGICINIANDKFFYKLANNFLFFQIQEELTIEKEFNKIHDLTMTRDT